MTPSPTRALNANDLASAATLRVQECFDREMEHFLLECQALGFNGREQMAGIITTAVHASAHVQAKAELAAIACSTSSEASQAASGRLHAHMQAAIPRLRAALIEELAASLRANQGEIS